MLTKICTKCDKELTLDQFHKCAANKDGHYTQCKACVKEYTKSHYANNVDRLKLKAKRYRLENPIKVQKLRASYYTTHKKQECLNSRKYRATRKPEIAAYNKAYHKANSGILIHKLRLRQLKDRTPTWSNRKAIKDIYINCPKGLVVDHIIPINSKSVSGLHVPCNLQYLTFRANASKSNKFTQDQLSPKQEALFFLVGLMLVAGN